jgi:hypothetical protein
MNLISNDESDQVNQMKWFAERINGVSEFFRYTVFYALGFINSSRLNP